MRKKLGITLAVTIAASNMASAQSGNWAGMYVGGALGGAAVSSEPVMNSQGPVSGQGVVGGLYFGSLWQQGSMYYGVEADAMMGALADFWVDGGQNYNLDEQYRASLRGIIGTETTFGLFYGTLGVAIANIDQWYSGGGFPDSTVANESLTGYVVGAGLRRQLSGNWRMKVEYTYTDYGSATFQCSVCGASSDEYASHTLVFGLEHKF